MIEVRTCQLFRKTSVKFARDARVRDKIADFIRSKSERPLEPYGSKDRPFAMGDLKGYMHVGLTFDVSLVYTMGKVGDQMTLDLLGVFTHDELGTGQPPKMNRQRAAADKFSNQTMEP